MQNDTSFPSMRKFEQTVSPGRPPLGDVGVAIHGQFNYHYSCLLYGDPIVLFPNLKLETLHAFN